MAQSISVSIAEASCRATASRVRSHSSSTHGTRSWWAPSRSTKARTASRCSRCRSRAERRAPSASRTGWVPVRSWETSRRDRTGSAMVRSGRICPASIIRSIRSVVPARRAVVVWDMVESPTITCSRR
ncbi:hypothetical protein BJF77_10445 [Kocuria sp. CNJ-770]|nr:hypothetical protein BJF77_10445 [Kocuria sp. CNJ-770]